MRPVRRFAGALAAAATLVTLWGAGPAAMAAESAVLIMYHRFGEDAYPSTNVRNEQFEAHLAELQSGKYRVLPLPEIVDAIRTGKPLPDRAVAITIDDAYRSVYTEAWPRLRATALPFTIFVATEPISANLPGYMTWDQLRELRDFGVTIGAHSHTHLHMPAASPETNKADLETSNRIFRKELGAVPELFAYPYGEASEATEIVVRAAGYKAAFGQHSSPLAAYWPVYYMPRFPLNESYGAIDRLRLILNALPLPVNGFGPVNPLVTEVRNPPQFWFIADASAGDLSSLACYRTGRGKIPVERRDGRRVEVSFADPFASGRTRINCTMPPAAAGRWRWFGMQYYVKP
ncbi:MAG: polysaccharide deacetylase family protein [Alphaproteobacteria bacterium]|nr:polysaccharide deacetylase family protein [Alphaproteobacteria bacterium]